MTGAFQVITNLENLSDDIWEAVCKAIDKRTTEVKENSQENYIPVDKGDLKASCKEKNVEDTKTAHINEISVGEGLDYAIPVHEILTNVHPRGSAKYLEIPLNDAENDIYYDVKDAVEGKLGN